MGEIWVLVEIENESIFPLDILCRIGGQNPNDRISAHRTKTEIRTEAHWLFSPSLCRCSCKLHLGVPLIISSHTCIVICLSVVFYTTQDDSVRLAVSYSASHKMAEFASLSHKHHSTIRQCLYQAQFHSRWQCLSPSPMEHHRRWQCLSLWVIFNITQEGFAFVMHCIMNTDGSVCLCVSYSASYKTALLASFQFQSHTPIGCN